MAQLGVVHELIGIATGEPLDEVKMDLLNNSKGLEIADRLQSKATDDVIAAMVVAALRTGNLVTTAVLAKLGTDGLSPNAQAIVLSRIIENITASREDTASPETPRQHER